jgi:hypothetical protein
MDAESGAGRMLKTDDPVQRGDLKEKRQNQ